MYDMESKRLIHFGFPTHAEFHRKKYTMGVNNMTDNEEKNKSSNDGYKDAEALIYKFKKEGDKIEGKLVSKKESEQFKNTNYKIETPEGEVVIVFGSVVLDSQMELVNVGDMVKIEYLGEKPNPKVGQNPTKLFNVKFKEQD